MNGIEKPEYLRMLQTKDKFTKAEARKAILSYLVKVLESTDACSDNSQIILNFDCLPLDIDHDDCDDITFGDLVRRVAR